MTPSETQRLQELYSLEILDSAKEEAFDRITQMAAALFDVPIAVVSLVDKDRQWFKSCIGLGVDTTARDVSFCTHSIESSEVMVVKDATKDPRFSANPFVINEPNIRFYAGAPLLTRTGMRLGTLCVIDSKPRSISAKEISFLETLAAQVMDEMYLRHTTILAERDSAAKTEFVARISDGIRTPLSTIISGINLLNTLGDASEMQKKVLATLVTSANGLLTLVNDVLKPEEQITELLATEQEKYAEEQAKCRVLLVEDYEANIMIARYILDELGYNYEIARDGQEAKDFAAKERFDIILLDVNLPKFNGYDVCHFIREKEKQKSWKHQYIIGLTAHAFESDRQKCFAAGMDDFMSKPLELNLLKQKLAEHSCMEREAA